jgi:hypothetical protein
LGSTFHQREHAHFVICSSINLQGGIILFRAKREIPDTTTGSTSVAFLKKKTQQMHAADKKKRMDFAACHPEERKKTDR